MRKTLADYMTNTLSLESAEVVPVTTIVSPVTIPEGLTERERDQQIILPSPAVAGSILTEVEVDGVITPLEDDDYNVTVIGDEGEIASAVVLRNRTLVGDVRVSYQPLALAQEDADKPFVQLGTVVEPGTEQANPYPANAPTETAAPQVTNEATVQVDKAELADKGDVASGATDQSVATPDPNAPKVDVTVIPKAGNPPPSDRKVVDANDGNTGEEKAEVVAEEKDLTGPAKEPDEGAESTDEEPGEGDGTEGDGDSDAENTDDSGEEDENDELDEEDEDLVEESFTLGSEVDAMIAGYAAEGDIKSFLITAWNKLVEYFNRIRKFVMDKIYSRQAAAERDKITDELRALKLSAEFETAALNRLAERYTIGIEEAQGYTVAMAVATNLIANGKKEISDLISVLFVTLNNGKGEVDTLSDKFRALFVKYNIKGLFEGGTQDDVRQTTKDIETAFSTPSKKTLTGSDLTARLAEITKAVAAYTEATDKASGLNLLIMKQITATATMPKNLEGGAELLGLARDAITYLNGAYDVSRAIFRGMATFVSAATKVVERQGLKTESFSQPIEVMQTDHIAEPVVIPTEGSFVTDTLVVRSYLDEKTTRIIRRDKYRVRTNEAGLGEAIVILDPELRGALRADYDKVIDGTLSPVTSEDPVVVISEVEASEGAPQVIIADATEITSDELPEELVEIREEGLVVLEAHQSAIKLIGSTAYMVDGLSVVTFEGDVQNVELVMEGLMDSIKGALTRLGNWFDKNFNYVESWEMGWNKELAEVNRTLADARKKTKNADVVKVGRLVRRMTKDGNAVTDLKALQKELTILSNVGTDGRAYIASIGGLYEDVRKLIGKHDNVNPDGAAILKDIPPLVKKINQRPWQTLIHSERQVLEKNSDVFPTSQMFLGELVVAEMQTMNDLTFANPDPALRKLLEKTYVGYNLEWTLDSSLTEVEMPVMSIPELEALIRLLRTTAEKWDMTSVFRDAGKKMDNFYRSLWSLKEYDRDFLSAYGVILAADQWMYHPVVDLYREVTLPLQAVLRLIKAHLACYK